MSCSLQGESEIVFIRSQSEHVVFYVGYAFGTHKERMTYAIGTCISREMHVWRDTYVFRWSSNDITGKTRNIKKLTTRETMLQTTVIQPMGKDLGFSVDWWISQVRTKCSTVHQVCMREYWTDLARPACPLDNLYCAWINEHASRRSEVNWRERRSGLGTEGGDHAHWPFTFIWNDEDADSYWGRGGFLSRLINIQVEVGFICLCLWRGLRNRILGICGFDIRAVYWPWVSPKGGPNWLRVVII